MRSMKSLKLQVVLLGLLVAFFCAGCSQAAASEKHARRLLLSRLARENAAREEQRWGWKKMSKGAKSVSKGVSKTAKAAAKTTYKAGKAAAKTTYKAGKAAGKATYKAGKAVGKTVVKAANVAAKFFKKIAQQVGNRVAKLFKKSKPSVPKGGKMPFKIDREAENLAQHVVKEINQRRKKYGLLELSLSTVKIYTYEQQVVAGTRHSFCLAATVMGKKEHFEAELYEPIGTPDKRQLVRVFPLSVVKGDKAPANDQILFRCPIETPESALLDMQQRYKKIQDAEESVFLDEHESKARARLMQKTVPPQYADNYDFREHTRPECVEALHYPYNQGGCGSCYAFAALSAASVRFCHAGHSMQSKRLAIKDVLECGTEWHGHACMKMGGRDVTNYANGCDGGAPYLVYHYAADHGLVEGNCHRYAVKGDPLDHMEPHSKKCIFRSTKSLASIACGGSQITDVPEDLQFVVKDKFCSCPDDQRKNYESIEIVSNSAE